MFEQRFEEYWNLINELLGCRSGEELEILHHHSNLVDTGLVQVMENVAAAMVEKGTQNAEWLQNFTANLKEYIGRWEQLNQRVVQLYQQGHYNQAVIDAENALELAKQIWGQEHTKVATSLNNLAELYSAQGRYAEAEPICQQAVEMRQRLLKGDHPNVATSLNNLASLYSEQGRYAEAEPICQQAVEMYQRLLKGDHPTVALSLNKLASLYSEQGRYAEAEPICQQAVEMYQRLFEGDHPDVATSLNKLANLYSDQGRYAEAEPKYQQALEMYQRLFKGDHPDVAISLNNLASLYFDQGRFAEAEPKFQQALEMKQRLFEGDHPTIATSLNNLAHLYSNQGRFAEAEPKFQQALEMYQRLFKGDHPDVAGSLNNLASLYSNQGRYAEAEPKYQQALEMYQRLFKGNHPTIATSLNNLAHLYSNQGRFAEAEPKFQQALEMKQRLFKGDHPDVAGSLNNLASLYSNQGRYAEAEPICQQALEMKQRLFKGDHPDVALSLNNLASLYSNQGRYAEAEPKYQQALEMYQRLFKGSHPDVTLSLNNLAIFFITTDRYPEALELMKEATAIENRLISQAFAYSSESDRLAYLQKIRKNFDGFLSLVYKHLLDSPQAVQAALDLVLQRKAITAAALAALNQAIYSGRYPELQPEFKKLRSLSDQIIHFTFTQPEPERLAQLQGSHNQLQKKLASQVPEIQLQDQPIDRRAVALELPEGSTLVEFVCFDVLDFHKLQWQPAHYIAFILPAGQPDNVQMIDLGEAEHIDRLIQIFRLSLSSSEGDTSGMSRKKKAPAPQVKTLEELASEAVIELQKVLFDPIRPYLQPHQHLLLAPDSNLNLIPFEILPTDETGKQLLTDEYRISYLSVGRDILRSKIKTTRPASQPLVIADPNFDLVKNNLPEKQTTSPQQTIKTSGLPDTSVVRLLETLGGFIFTSVPSTRILAEDIANNLNVLPKLGDDALESHLTTCQSPRILVIATHGVFLPEETALTAPIPFHLGREQEFSIFNRLTHTKVADPMLRSGLAFAGGNNWLKSKKIPENAEKGFLFAQEVAAVDLWATEIAVLSACDTAMGDIKIGEGVFGLRRAFAVAGAKTLIMSLWSVPTLATVLLMQRFFNNLDQGLGRGASLREAQNYIRTITVKKLQQFDLGQKVLDELVEIKAISQDLESCQDDQPLAHPFFWGAWICQGDTTAIKPTKNKFLPQ
jgi:tetratricopeptide (TPR) repeat protein